MIPAKFTEVAHEAMQEAGWLVSDKSNNRFSLLVKTAVGEKEAKAEMFNGSVDPGEKALAVLRGHYESEGRNVLAASGVLIPLDADEKKVREMVKGFCECTNKAIEQSYARNLYAAHGVKPKAPAMKP